MSEERVPRRFVDTEKSQFPQNFGKPKIHVLTDKPPIYSSNWISTNANDCKPEKKNFKYYLEYYKRRKLSVIMNCLALAILLIMIAMETAVYRIQPTETSLEDDMYPVQKIDFPAVSICSLNVISRKEVTNFAKTLWLKGSFKDVSKNLTLEKTIELLKYMGSLYEFDDRYDRENLELLHEILETTYGKNYDVEKIMKTLSPSCHEFFVSCLWQGGYRQCEELFVYKWTSDGYCCTFNDVRWSASFTGDGQDSFKLIPERFEAAGTDYGLTVILRPRLEDYYYTTLPGQGFKVMLYTPSDYPDGPSGGLREVLVSPGTETFVYIDASLFHSSPEIIKYTKEERKCSFNTESPEIYGGSYSYSQCLMLCRIEDIVRQCKCVPFFYPTSKDLFHTRKCTVMDLRCLAPNKYKWWSLEPVQNEFSDPSSVDGIWKSGESLRCDCFPSCDNVHYSIYSSSSKINDDEASVTPCSNATMEPGVSVLRVSYSGIGTMRLKQDVMYHWYDLLSKFGGLCSFCLGISILTPLEILYSLWIRFVERKKSKIATPIERLTVESAKIKFRKYSIYWNELKLSRPFKSSVSSAVSSLFHRR